MQTVRTTLVLQERLVKKAKPAALDKGMTLSDIVNEALAETLSRKPKGSRKPFRVRIRPLGVTALTPADMWEVLEADDARDHQKNEWRR